MDGVRSCAARTVLGLRSSLLMACSVQLKLKILLTAILLTTIPLIGSATVPCTFENKGLGGGPSFKFNFSKEECRLVETRNGSVVTLTVQYPEMKLIGARVVDDSVVVLRMSHIDSERYDQNGIIGTREPDRRLGTIDIYDVGSDEMYRFRGKDGEVVFVRNMGNTYLAKRLVAGDVFVFYQYSKNHQDLEYLDATITGFLSQKLVR
ncbi:hypothetical protein PS687_05176 [Pseudomonas fluorescens]|nr:hypothetical protein PS687_05176 [Pseudomonas fluorescens]